MQLLTTAVSPKQSFMDSHSCCPVCESSTIELIRALLCVLCVCALLRFTRLPASCGCNDFGNIHPSIVCRYFPSPRSLSECWGLFQFWRSRLITLMGRIWLLSRSLPIPTQNKLLLILQQPPAFWWQLTPHCLSAWSIHFFFRGKKKHPDQLHYPAKVGEIEHFQLIYFHRHCSRPRYNLALPGQACQAIFQSLPQS